MPEGNETDPIEDSADLTFKASFYGDEKTIAFLFHQNIAKHVDFAGESVNHGLCLTLTSGSGGVIAGRVITLS